MPGIAIAHSAAHGRLARSADPDRWMWRAHRPWRRMHLLKRNPAALVRDHITRPALADHFQILVRQCTAMVERHAERGELLLRPTYPDAQNEPAAAQLIDVRRHARRLQRMAIG